MNHGHWRWIMGIGGESWALEVKGHVPNIGISLLGDFSASHCFGNYWPNDFFWYTFLGKPGRHWRIGWKHHFSGETCHGEVELGSMNMTVSCNKIYATLLPYMKPVFSWLCGFPTWSLPSTKLSCAANSLGPLGAFSLTLFSTLRHEANSWLILFCEQNPII